MSNFSVEILSGEKSNVIFFGFVAFCVLCYTIYKVISVLSKQDTRIEEIKEELDELYEDRNFHRENSTVLAEINDKIKLREDLLNNLTK